MAKEKEKICSHCEGRISVEADTCLYCGMPLIAAATTSSPSFPGLQEGVPSLYSPSYSQKNTEYMKADYMKVENDFVGKFKPAAPQEDSLGGISIPSSVAAVAQEEEGAEKSGFVALFLVFLGSNLLTLGLMQALFSEGGVLRLEWNCKYWFLLCLLSAPMIYFGIKKSKGSV